MKGVLNAKTANLDATIKQTGAEMQDSLVKFSSNLTGTGVNTHLNIKSQMREIRQMKDEADIKYQARMQRKGAKRAGLQSATQSNGVGQAITSASDAMSQTMGPPGGHQRG